VQWDSTKRVPSSTNAIQATQESVAIVLAY